MTENNFQSGSIDALDRVMQELLKTPKFKEGVKIFLKSIDPQSTPGLVKTLMWQDPEIFLAVAGVAPDIVNSAILGGNELINQTEKLPPPLLAEFLSAFITKLNGEALGELLSSLIDLYSNTRELENDSLKSAAENFHDSLKEGLGKEGGGAYATILTLLQPMIKEQIANLAKEAKEEKSETALLIKGLSQTIREAVKENPDFLTHVYTPLTEAFTKTEKEPKPQPQKKPVKKATAKTTAKKKHRQPKKE